MESSEVLKEDIEALTVSARHHEATARGFRDTIKKKKQLLERVLADEAEAEIE